MKSSLEVENAVGAPGPSDKAEQWAHLLHREIVQRVVVSPTFAKSERLCALLTYVCDMKLKGRAAEINEQKIGHAVFGRQQDYDSSVDGIVRTQASRLRQRLETYYQREGAGEATRILIPRGSYVPRFVLHTSLPEVVAQTPVAASPHDNTPVIPAANMIQTNPEAVARVTGATMILAVACALLLVAAGSLVVRERSERLGVAAKFSHPLWSQIFVAGQPTLEVPGDSGLVLFHHFDGRTIPLNEYLVGAYRNSAPHGNQAASADGPSAAVFANSRYTSIVDLDAAVTFSRIAQAAHSSLQVRYARDIRPNDLKTGNVILFGAAEANPWVELFERNMNFSLHNDYQTHVFSVLNRSPKAGEPRHWESTASDPEHRVYGIVGYRPSLSGNGKALIVEGTSMAGCEAALDFLLDDAQLSAVLSLMHHSGRELPYFELLVTTQNTGASAVHSSLVAMRTAE